MITFCVIEGGSFSRIAKLQAPVLKCVLFEHVPHATLRRYGNRNAYCTTGLLTIFVIASICKSLQASMCSLQTPLLVTVSAT